MSQLNVNTIKNRTGTSGPVLSGLSTVSGSLVVSSDATVSGAATVTGALTVGGVLTYEDVTNVDSVGIVTARTGLEVTANGLVINAGVSTFAADLSIADKIIHTGDTDTAIRFPAANTFTVETAGSEAIRVDSSQRLLVNTATTRNNYDNGSVTSNLLHVERTAASGNAGISICANAATAADVGAILYMGRTSATSNGGNTIVADDDLIGRISFQGADGSQLVEAASIKVDVDGTPGADDMPGRIEFHTTADGASSATERVRIDSSGRLNIGSFSAPGTVGGFSHINVHGTGINANGAIGLYRNSASPSAGQGIGAIYFANSDGNPGAYIQGQSDGTWGTDDYPGRLVFFTTADGASSATERMRIDSSGRMGLGTNSPSSYIGSGDNFVIAESGDAGITIATGTSDTGTINFADGTSGDARYRGRFEYSHSLDALDILTAASTRMRVTSDGKIRIKMNDFANDPSASNSGLQLFDTSGGSIISASPATTDSDHALFFNPNGIVGRIRTSGSATSYNTSSDYRLKENVVDLDGAITRVKQLAPKRFNFISDADTTVDGFLAHEAQTVVPEAVTGTHNEVDGDGNPVIQGIDQAKLVPLLTAALKEAITKIETLETKVAALEGS